MADGGGTSLVAESFEIAFFSVAGTVVTAVVGALAVWLQYVDGPTLKRLAALNLDLLLPALSLSLFTAFTADRLARWIVVPIAATLHIAIGCALGGMAAWLLQMRSPRRQLLVLSSGFHNCGAIPFMLAQPIVNNWRRAADEADALVSINGMIGLYVVVWLLLFSLFGRAYAATIATTAPQQLGAAEDGSAHSRRRRLVRACGGPSAVVSLLAILLAVLLGCVPPLHDAFSNGPLQFVGGAWRDLGRAFVTLTVLTLGASLQMAVAAWRMPQRSVDVRTTGQKAGEAPRAVAGAANREAANGEAANGEAANGEVRDADEVHVAVGDTAGGDSDVAGGGSDVSLVCAAIVLKLILVPVVCVPLTYAAHHLGLLPDEPLLLLVLYITPSLPSSQTALSLLHAKGESRVAARLSQLYVPQYLLSTVTIAATVAVAVNLIGDAPLPSATNNQSGVHVA